MSVQKVCLSWKNFEEVLKLQNLSRSVISNNVAFDQEYKYVLKKLVGLIIFAKDIFDIYLNAILSFHYTWLVNV